MEETISSSVEERVLFYLRSVSPEHELRGIESLLRLRCSRRQLQRVLGKLLAEGRIRKIGGDAIGWNQETAKLPNENRPNYRIKREPNCRIEESQITE